MAKYAADTKQPRSSLIAMSTVKEMGEVIAEPAEEMLMPLPVRGSITGGETQYVSYEILRAKLPKRKTEDAAVGAVEKKRCA
ncbi:hypothetical protein LTR53_018092 [Teratosphaeriaceae sp. CCFEE 6253]|nr:hypothetical protein LTR53_018092 [Teratosphaeriaceae sp. CCFEE 6253]